ncbi:MAG: hypothetical protein ACXWN0_17375 [Isosphaeraceae bacterium]
MVFIRLLSQGQSILKRRATARRRIGVAYRVRELIDSRLKDLDLAGNESQHGRWNDFPWDPCATQMPEKEAIAKIVSTVIGSLLSRFR